VDTGNGPLHIGAYTANGPYYGGVIHEVKVFRRALSPEELVRGPAGKTGGRGPAVVTFNPGCERLDSRGRPLGWRVLGKQRTGIEWGAAPEAHAGAHALAVRFTGTPGKENSEFVLVHGQDTPSGDFGYPAAPGAVYRVSLWVKGDVGRIRVQPVGWAPGTGPKASKALATFPVWTGARWTRAGGTFSIPDGIARFGLMLRIPPVPAADGAKHGLLLDDIVIERIPGDLAGWWRLDTPNLPVARDLTGACPDGAVYRVWRVGAPPPANRKPRP